MASNPASISSKDRFTFVKLGSVAAKKLHHMLKLSYENGALISCTVGGPYVREALEQKLQSRHAYTLTKITKVKSFENHFDNLYV